MRLVRLLAVVVASALLALACDGAVQEPAEDGASPAAEGTAGETPDASPGASPAATEMGELVPPLTLWSPVVATSPQNFNSAPLIADWFRELGYDITVETEEFVQLRARIREGDPRDYELALWQWVTGVERLDPFFFLSIYLPGETVGSGWQNAEYIELIEQQSATIDEDERREYVFRAQEILMDPGELPQTVTFSSDTVIGYRADRFGNLAGVPGEGLHSEWIILAEPLGDSRVLRVGTARDPESLSPTVAVSADAWAVFRHYYDRLVRLSPDVEPQPWAAESFEFVDPQTVEVVLREGMTFHDGEPVTVEDVKYSYELFMNNEIAYFGPFVATIGEVEVVDERTIVFHLTEPTSSFINVTLTRVPILPSHIWGGMEDPMAELAYEDVPTVGSGPFMLDRFVPQEALSLVKNPDHFAAEDIQLDAIEYHWFADTEGIVTALQTGDIDMHNHPLQPAQIDLLADTEGLEFDSVPGIGFNYLSFNTDVPPTDDPAVRAAFAHAIDREALVDVVVDGRGDPGVSVITPANTRWHNPDVYYYDFDIERARQILADAGYTWDDDGRIHYPADR